MIENLDAVSGKSGEGARAPSGRMQLGQVGQARLAILQSVIADRKVFKLTVQGLSALNSTVNGLSVMRKKLYEHAQRRNPDALVLDRAVIEVETLDGRKLPSTTWKSLYFDPDVRKANERTNFVVVIKPCVPQNLSGLVEVLEDGTQRPVRLASEVEVAGYEELKPLTASEAEESAFEMLHRFCIAYNRDKLNRTDSSVSAANLRSWLEYYATHDVAGELVVTDALREKFSLNMHRAYGHTVSVFAEELGVRWPWGPQASKPIALPTEAEKLEAQRIVDGYGEVGEVSDLNFLALIDRVRNMRGDAVADAVLAAGIERTKQEAATRAAEVAERERVSGPDTSPGTARS